MKDIKLEVPATDFSSIKDFDKIDDGLKNEEVTVTTEEQQMVFKGIRPEGMRYDVFRKVRKDLQKATRLYLGGQFKHVAVNLNPKLGEVESKGTYYRTGPRRHQTLGRKYEYLTK